MIYIFNLTYHHFDKIANKIHINIIQNNAAASFAYRQFMQIEF